MLSPHEGTAADAKWPVVPALGLLSQWEDWSILPGTTWMPTKRQNWSSAIDTILDQFSERHGEFSGEVRREGSASRRSASIRSCTTERTPVGEDISPLPFTVISEANVKESLEFTLTGNLISTKIVFHP